MEAPDARAVVERLQRDAYFPIAIDAQDQRRRLAGPRLARDRAAAVSRAATCVALTQQLATLVEAGLPLDRALAIQAELAPTPAAARHHGRRAAQRAGRHRPGRGARQASPAAVLAPLHQHGAGGREGRRARDHAAPARRVPRGGAGVPRRAGLRADLPAAAHRRRRRRGRLPDDLRHPALRGDLQGPGRDHPAAHADPARGERRSCSTTGGCSGCWPRPARCRQPRGAGDPREAGSMPTGCCCACRSRAGHRPDRRGPLHAHPRHPAQERRAR